MLLLWQQIGSPRDELSPLPAEKLIGKDEEEFGEERASDLTSKSPFPSPEGRKHPK